MLPLKLISTADFDRRRIVHFWSMLLQSGEHGFRGQSPAPIDPVRAAFRRFLLDIALNAFFPLVLYRLSKRYFSASEFTALAVATTFPLGKSIFDVAKRRRLDPVSVIVLLGIGASAIALLAGGSPRLLLMRESLFTAIFGLACFASLLLPRPMMFYFGRHFMAGGDATKRRRYEASWALPDVRFSSRLITVVWGSVYLGEFAIRVALIALVPVSWVLAISPVLLGSLTLVTIVWTFRYAKAARARAIPKVDELMRRETE
jgi:hypothetical protein